MNDSETEKLFEVIEVPIIVKQLVAVPEAERGDPRVDRRTHGSAAGS